MSTDKQAPPPAANDENSALATLKALLVGPEQSSIRELEKESQDPERQRRRIADALPDSLHQRILWRDGFSCLLSRYNPIRYNFDLDNYLAANHVWVSKTGMGVGVGVNPDDVQRLGWVDAALAKLDDLYLRMRTLTASTPVAPIAPARLSPPPNRIRISQGTCLAVCQSMADCRGDRVTGITNKINAAHIAIVASLRLSSPVNAAIWGRSIQARAVDRKTHSTVSSRILM